MKPDHEQDNTAVTPEGESGPEATPGPESAVEGSETCAQGTSAEAADSAANAPEATPEQLRAEVEALEAAVASQKDEVLRMQAEMDNLRKRSAREVENAHKFGLEKFINELLPVRDSLELGLSAATDDGVDVASVREGLELTLKMLDTATGKFGLEEVDPAGESFDPERHQAISMQEAPGTDSGVVLNVIQKGFVLNDRLVRPAMVIVSS